MKRVVVCVLTMFRLWVIDLGGLNLWIYFQLYRTKSYHISQLCIISKQACAVSVVLLFWDAAAVWEAFAWDHWCDETPPGRTANQLKFYSRQADYAALALFTWNLNRAWGTKATVAVWWFFFTGHQGHNPSLSHLLWIQRNFMPEKQ